MNIFNKLLEMVGFEKNMGAMVTRWRLKRPTPKITQPVSINTTSPIHYLINDPTTPLLFKDVIPPVEITQPSVVVKDYKGGGFDLSSVEGQSANVLITINNIITYLNTKSEKSIPNWPGTSTLYVLPRAGEKLNAFYNRRTLQFFYSEIPALRKIIYLCESSEIVGHEFGHAILDAYRPDLWNASFLEVHAFHETFADFVAMIHVLTFDESIAYILNETNNDLTKPNVASRTAEHLAHILYKIADKSEGFDESFLRNAINDFKYVNPSSLPETGTHNQLTAESHSFSRIMSGALYEILVMIYDDLVSAGETNSVALTKARDLLTTYVMKSIQNAPVNGNFFSSFAKTMLWADVTLSNWKYHDRMQKIFMNRNIVTIQLNMLSESKCDNDLGIVKNTQLTHLKLSDHLLRIQSENALYDVELEVPTESASLYDANKNLYDVIYVSNEDTLSAAQDTINYLYLMKMVSDDENALFEIKDGKLLRRRT